MRRNAMCVSEILSVYLSTSSSSYLTFNGPHQQQIRFSRSSARCEREKSTSETLQLNNKFTSGFSLARCMHLDRIKCDHEQHLIDGCACGFIDPSKKDLCCNPHTSGLTSTRGKSIRIQKGIKLRLLTRSKVK